MKLAFLVGKCNSLGLDRHMDLQWPLNQMRRAALLGAYLVAVAAPGRAAHVDVSQASYQGVQDLSQGDRSGQTFIAQESGLLVGVRLVVQGGSWGPSYPAGSDTTVRVRKLGSNGVPLENPLAIGKFLRGQIDRNTPHWIDVIFETPYLQTAGESLALMLECETSGSQGWTDFGFLNGDPYPDGRLFHLNWSDSFATPSLGPSTVDLAFETLVLPEPATAVLFVSACCAMLNSKRRSSGASNALAAHPGRSGG